MAKTPTVEFKEWFAEKIDRITPFLKSKIAEEKQISPTLVVFGHEENEVAVEHPPMGTLQEKQISIYAMKELAKRTAMVKGVIFFTEAWIVESKTIPEGTKSLEGVPGRKECVLFTAIMDGMQLTARAPIDRLNGISIMGLISYDGFDHVKGRMAID
jgi:hypothetical protein